jgi:formylglycine-generating enzyme required for sulfatase activity
MSNPNKSHDQIFSESSDLVSKPHQEEVRTSAPLQPSPPQPIAPPVANRAERIAQPLHVQRTSELHYSTSHYIEDRESRVGIYIAGGIFFIVLLGATYWLGMNSDFSFEIPPGASPQAASNEESARQANGLTADSPGESRPPELQSIKPIEISNDFATAKTSLVPSSTKTPEVITSIDSVVARLARLDDEFSRLKIDLIDLQRDEVKRLKALAKNVTLSKAIATGRLQLRASADPASKNLIPLVYIPAGDFVIGQTEVQRKESARASSAAHYDFSVPAHPIRVQSGYFMGVYEITICQLTEFLEFKRSTGAASVATTSVTRSDPNFPASSVDWETAVEYCDWLSQLNEGIAVRLPTEIEWEYAARGNSYIQQFETLREPDVRFGGPWSVDNNSLDRSWCGCVAMNSNVQEWTIDAWDELAYARRAHAPGSSHHSPIFVYTGFDQSLIAGPHSSRAVRGSSFRDIAGNQNAALRRFKPATATEDTLGFRIVVPVSVYPSSGE